MQAARVIPSSEREQATGTIVAAFLSDPILRWLYPDVSQYLKVFPSIVDAFAGKAFETGSALSFAGSTAVALWLKPGVEPDADRLGAIMQETVHESLMEDLNGFFEMQLSLHPHEPHWYLPLIGVDPIHQGQGLGSALIKHSLALTEEAGLPAYLEATSDNNRRLYERHGFEVVGKIQFGQSPTMWPMWRPVR